MITIHAINPHDLTALARKDDRDRAKAEAKKAQQAASKAETR